MAGIDEIVRSYRNRIERCEEKDHAGQVTSMRGNCESCLTWQVELLVLGRDPKTGQRFSDSTIA